MNTPKIVFKSDIPEDALNSLAAVFIEQIEKLVFAYLFGKGIVRLFNDFVYNVNYAVLNRIVSIDDGSTVVYLYKVTIGVTLVGYS